MSHQHKPICYRLPQKYVVKQQQISLHKPSDQTKVEPSATGSLLHQKTTLKADLDWTKNNCFSEKLKVVFASIHMVDSWHKSFEPAWAKDIILKDSIWRASLVDSHVPPPESSHANAKSMFVEVSALKLWFSLYLSVPNWFWFDLCFSRLNWQYIEALSDFMLIMTGPLSAICLFA